MATNHSEEVALYTYDAWARNRIQDKKMKSITVLIPVSPIPTHPSAEVIEQTIASIRERLPDSEIIIMFDGVAPWLMEYKAQYEEFKQRFLWECNTKENMTPMVFDSHSHQSLMMREALKLVRTAVILFSEQDTPLHNDIPFEQIVEPIKAGYANLIRFHFEAQIHPEHQHLMLDQTPQMILGVPLLRTIQWSQRPHLASTEYYRTICDKYWDDKPRFIEHIMYGRVVEGDFEEHRLHMYAPEGTLVRSLHIDGRRKGAAEYDPTPS